MANCNNIIIALLLTISLFFPRVKVLPKAYISDCVCNKGDIRIVVDENFEAQYTERTTVLISSKYMLYNKQDIESVMSKLPKCNVENCHIKAAWNYSILNQCLPGAPIFYMAASRTRDGKETLHEWIFIIDEEFNIHNINGDIRWYDTISFIKT